MKRIKGRETIQSELLMCVILMCQRSECMPKTVPPKSVRLPDKPEPTEDVKKAIQLGFDSWPMVVKYNLEIKIWKSSCYILNQEHRERVMEIEKYNLKIAEYRSGVSLLKKARRFYKDALLIPYDDFEKVMTKYNLKCTKFDWYKGDIPSEMLMEIEKSCQAAEKMGRYVNRLSLDFHSRGKFPFYKSSDGIKTFICAPADDIAKDPFICAHTDYGILVFARWGEEANDLIINRYEQLDNLLDRLPNKINPSEWYGKFRFFSFNYLMTNFAPLLYYAYHHGKERGIL